MTPSAILTFYPPLNPLDDSPPSEFTLLVLTCCTSLTSDENGVGEGVSGDPKCGDGEGAVGEDGDRACNDRATSSAPLFRCQRRR